MLCQPRAIESRVASTLVSLCHIIRYLSAFNPAIDIQSGSVVNRSPILLGFDSKWIGNEAEYSRCEKRAVIRGVEDNSCYVLVGSIRTASQGPQKT